MPPVNKKLCGVGFFTRQGYIIKVSVINIAKGTTEPGVDFFYFLECIKSTNKFKFAGFGMFDLVGFSLVDFVCWFGLLSLVRNASLYFRKNTISGPLR